MIFKFENFSLHDAAAKEAMIFYVLRYGQLCEDRQRKRKRERDTLRERLHEKTKNL